MIALIGGGEIGLKETYKIDEYIVKSTKIKTPNHLFIPTASHESSGYIETVKTIYSSLGCNCDSLCLIENEISTEEIENKINSADIIYVGGGDTNFMISEWKKRGIDVLLKKAEKNGKILSGLSAGAICWFEYGISDSDSFANSSDWEYINVKGLGLLPGLICPHFNEREKEKKFNEFINRNKKDFIAIENNCAIIINNGEYRIIKSDETKNAYIVNKYGKKERIEEIGKTANLLKN